MSTSLYQHLKNNYSFLRFLEHERVKEINISGDVIESGCKVSRCSVLCVFASFT